MQAEDTESVKPSDACQCESLDCEHDYLSVKHDSIRCDYIGFVCRQCARTHLADYLIPTATDGS